MSTPTSAAAPLDNQPHMNSPLPADTHPTDSQTHDTNHLDSTPQQQTVRFSSKNQEIEPDESLQHAATLTNSESPRETLSPKAKEELQNLAITLQKSRLQQQRMANFAFDPVSLPASRAASRDASPVHSPQYPRSRSGTPSPRPSPPVTDVNSPPLTPSESGPRSTEGDPGKGRGKCRPDAAIMTPQTSHPHSSLAPISPGVMLDETKYPSSATSRPSSSSEPISTRPTSLSEGPDATEGKSKHVARFTLGSPADSPYVSKESSPVGTPRNEIPFINAPAFSHQPLAPPGDANDPYARNKREPQNLRKLEDRFLFSGKSDRRRSGLGGSGSLPYSRSGTDLKLSDKRGSGFFKKDDLGGLERPHGSMAELKRFFRLGNKNKRAHSPAPSFRSSRSGTRTPPHQLAPSSVPFADDHGLESKYGKFGKVLGSGAGGSVRVLKRQTDGVTFAVKQFRDRHSWETAREYSKKVTAEFCIGSTLHHGNIIETLDIIHEKGHWYEVMEYAPYDLFAAVMTGKMTREEVTCTFLQITNGVTYLHSMGLAHRDLKLDNVVVNEHGIMKLIDFGSASVFRYPFENEIVLATGIVGSDPYLAPEVYDQKHYDPQSVDIWSLAIIYCCMTLRRFPWKMPRLTDHSYKLFVAPPSPGTPIVDPLLRPPPSEQTPSRSTGDLSTREIAPSAPASRQNSNENSKQQKNEPKSEPVSRTEGSQPSSNTSKSRHEQSNSKSEVIKGPWRLMRLLPRESRHVIAGMLRVDPKKRMKLAEVLQDPWIAGAAVCRQDEDGKVYRASGHVHTLEPGTGAVAVPSKR
ncbi:MAG: serine/threonine protein kinase [Cirrosporium novae-zelandiae]|nr:MAG: serine/threonine protein kinase [Cirrosporium novae-zelandiae]